MNFRFCRSWEGMLGAGILIVVVLMAIFASTVRPGDPQAIVAAPLLPPFTNISWPLGTDRLGRDILSGILYGARVTLIIATVATMVTVSLGTIMGTVAGFMGKRIDEIVMRFAEAFQAVPGFILVLALVAVLGSSILSTIIGIAASSWAGLARVVRAEILSLREREFVAADRAIGMRPFDIAFREVLPNALPAVFSMTSVIIASAILIEAALSFLGLGDPNYISWGKMVAEGRTVLRSAPYLSIIPGIAIVLVVLAVNLVGEGVIETISPRKKF
jgi:peptide/nickel transport system permease protein